MSVVLYTWDIEMDDDDYEFAYDSTYETYFETSNPKKPEKKSEGNPIKYTLTSKIQNVSYIISLFLKTIEGITKPASHI